VSERKSDRDENHRHTQWTSKSFNRILRSAQGMVNFGWLTKVGTLSSVTNLSL
jgi:hypothetical protein